LFWEKTAVTAALLPILSLGYLHEGNLGRRLLATLRLWRGWLLTALPLIGYVGYFVSAGYGGASRSVGVRDLAGVLWLQWSRVIGPSLFGGPWTWFDTPGVSLGYAWMSRPVMVATELAVLGLMVAGVLLVGWRSLLGWLVPAVPLVIGTSVIAFGRFAFFGKLISTTLRYGADLAVPLFLGVALALTPTSAAAIARRCRPVTEPTPSPAGSPATDTPAIDSPVLADAARPASAGRRAPWWKWSPVAVLALAGAVWLLGASLSVARFDRHWAANPTHRYVRTLTAGIEQAGPTANLYDTTVSQSVLPIFFGPHWHMSDFLPLTGHVPNLDAPSSEPLLADDQGRLRPAALVPAVFRQPSVPGGLCTFLVQGSGTFRIPFDTPAPEGDGFLRVDYLQFRPSTVEILVEDISGRTHAPVAGSRVVAGQTLGALTLRLPITSVSAVIVQSSAPDTHLCINRLTVGAPFVIGGSR
jgi:hypothetical protein